MNKKYLCNTPISANLKIKKSVIEIKIVIAVINPASNPKIFTVVSNNSSSVDGIINSCDVILLGIANFKMFDIAFIIKSIRKNIENDFAYFFNFGNFFLIPLANIPP